MSGCSAGCRMRRDSGRSAAAAEVWQSHRAPQPALPSGTRGTGASQGRSARRPGALSTAPALRSSARRRPSWLLRLSFRDVHSNHYLKSLITGLEQLINA